jgi:hypothetical protein
LIALAPSREGAIAEQRRKAIDPSPRDDPQDLIVDRMS